MSNEEVQVAVEEVVAVEEAAPVAVEEVVQPEPQPEPAPAPKAKKAHAAPVSGVGIVVSGADTDDVRLDKCVFKNMAAKKSLSVHHVQRKLTALGYRDAASDKDGWYGDHTLLAVAAYQQACGIEGDGLMNAATLEKLFADEPFINVIV
jgi:hypothetical protein